MPEPTSPLNENERRDLLDVAFESISHGLRHGVPTSLQPAQLPGALQQIRASFVTLKIADELRGCIGSLEAVRPLAEDVNSNAFAAAFRDPRFLPLTTAELHTLQISISVLSIPQPMRFASEAELVAQLRPGFDGLILEEGRCRGTFLPAVWESLPEPQAFLRHLKLKTGLHPDYWSQGLKAYSYYTEVISGDH
jgi:AmmeMemoRadiSam system protein A